MSIAQAILGAGSVRLSIYNPDTQTWPGLGDPVGADRFSITPQSETREKTSKRKENYGQAVASVVISQPTQIAITLSALDRDALAAQFQGVLAPWTQGAVVSAEVDVTAKLDKWISVGVRNAIGAGFAVKNAAGTTTYELGTDYEVNYWSGEIKPLSTGDIEADQALKVTRAAAAIDGSQIRGGVRPQVRVHALFDGVNKVDDKEVECEVWEAVLTASNEFDFLADDFNGIELTGTLVVPAGKTEPYVVRLKN
ncbi:MAG: hypothetical protein J0H69_19520 [Burkholderiales bacterium]|nr:hypothetical protein [Burkholderiales bacterium]